MRIALWPIAAREELIARLRGIAESELSVVENVDELIAVLPHTVVLVIGSNFYDARVAEVLRSHAPALRFIQLLTAGYEGPLLYGVPPGVRVANAGDAWSPAVAEHVMTLLLALTRCVPQILQNQSRRAWGRGFVPSMGSLQEKTLAVIGFGSIGREVARRARPFGMRIIGVSRSAKPDALADEVQPASELRGVLARADAIVLAVPFSPETEHMIGAGQLAACRPGAVLINVARGGLIDSAALADALKRGTIAGAGLDVTAPEPLPADHPLWGSPNLIISPHVAGIGGASGRARLARFTAENVARFVSGEAPTHLVAL